MVVQEKRFLLMNENFHNDNVIKNIIGFCRSKSIHTILLIGFNKSWIDEIIKKIPWAFPSIGVFNNDTSNKYKLINLNENNINQLEKFDIICILDIYRKIYDPFYILYSKTNNIIIYSNFKNNINDFKHHNFIETNNKFINRKQLIAFERK